MQYTSTVAIESAAIPGVTFHIHKPSYGRRIEFDARNAGFREKVREIAKAHGKLREEYMAIVAEFQHEIDRQITDLKKTIADAREEEVAAIEIQIAQLEASAPPEDVTKDLLDQMEAYGEQSLRLTSTDYNPQRIAWGLARIEGLEIDGAQADVQSLLASGPYELTMEILNAIDAVSGLSSEQLKNLPSPITFSAVVAATTPSMIASAASTPESTDSETAAE
jgi:hypothetical protein